MGSELKGIHHVLNIIPVWSSGDQANRACVAQVTVSKWMRSYDGSECRKGFVQLCEKFLSNRFNDCSML